MKRFFALIATMLLASASVAPAQEWNSSVTVDGGFMSHSIDTRGNKTTCFSAFDQTACFTQDHNGEFNRFSVQANFPVSPGTSATFKLAGSRDGYVSGCGGIRAGVPGANVSASLCGEIQDDGQVNGFSDFSGQIGPASIHYQSPHVPIGQ